MPLTVEIPRQKEMLRNGGKIRSKMCLVLPLLSTHDPAKCALTSHQKNRREYGREGLPPPFSTGLRRIFPRSAPFRPEGRRRRRYPRSDRPGGPEGGAGAVISAGCFFLGGRGMAVPKIFLCRHVDRGRMCKCGDDGRTTTFWTASLDCFARNPTCIDSVACYVACNVQCSYRALSPLGQLSFTTESSF